MLGVFAQSRCDRQADLCLGSRECRTQEFQLRGNGTMDCSRHIPFTEQFVFQRFALLAQDRAPLCFTPFIAGVNFEVTDSFSDTGQQDRDALFVGTSGAASRS